MALTAVLDRPLDGLADRARAARKAVRETFRKDPRLAVAAVLGLPVVAIAGIVQLTSSRPAQAAPPTPPPMAVRSIAPDQAVAVNAAAPLINSSNPAALPFQLSGSSASRAQALECLASAVYYEAGNQDPDGARAVAQVILNRVRHPAFPASVCGVVYQGSTRFTGCQFTFTCDGSLRRQPDPAGWRRAQAVAQAALGGAVYAPVGWATHYHANYVVPVWAATLAKNAIVGVHLFYHWAGGWGRPGAYSQGYLGREANADGLRSAALAVEATDVPRTVTGAPLATAIAEIPGAEPLKITPSMRVDKRVAVRFNQVARKAADEAPKRDYATTFAASDNLKWALSEEPTASREAPLGAASKN